MIKIVYIKIISVYELNTIKHMQQKVQHINTHKRKSQTEVVGFDKNS